MPDKRKMCSWFWNRRRILSLCEIDWQVLWNHRYYLKNNDNKVSRVSDIREIKDIHEIKIFCISKTFSFKIFTADIRGYYEQGHYKFDDHTFKTLVMPRQWTAGDASGNGIIVPAPDRSSNILQCSESGCLDLQSTQLHCLKWV